MSFPDSDLQRRFGGIDRLYGADTLSRLLKAHACVIGIGGVGSWAAEALARSGVGQLTLIDLDHIAESNMNRQIHALESTLGMAKGEAMRQRIAQINPACRVDFIDAFIDADNVAALLPACDAVIDAIDNVRAKAALLAHCRRHKQYVITTGGAGGRIDPTRVEVTDLSRTLQDVLASKVRAKLRKDYGFAREPKKKFGIDCVFSQEPIRQPRRPTTTDFCEAPVDGAAGLACAGYGSSVAVTASFGFAAAARTIDHLLKVSP
jgi:tRNA A37 threonylcarbamoyladenosine dehydratase